MPAEWQARQLLLAASAPGPSNMRSPVGRSTLTDFSVSFSFACAQSGRAITARTAICARARMPSSLRRHDGRLLDDVAHESGGIPVRRLRLGLAARAGAARHEDVFSRSRQGKRELPLAEAVFTFVLAELSPLPGPGAIGGDIDVRDAHVAAERDAAHQRRRARPHRIARLDVGDEGAWNHPVD